MYNIVITGIQTSENGSIEWGRELPANCQLTRGLKKVVTPLLAGLLEVDTQKIWTFERFFSEVTLTLSKILVNVFHVNTASRIEIFIHPDETYEHLQTYITEQTEIQPDNQILIYKSNLFSMIVDESMPARGYPKTSPQEPVLLYSKENNNIYLNPDMDVPKFPVFPNLVSVENDATQAKSACSVGHVCKREIERLSHSSQLMQQCVNDLTKVITKDLTKLYQKSLHISDLVHYIKETADILKNTYKSMNVMIKKFNCDSLNDKYVWSDKIDALNKELQQICSAVHQLHQRNVVEDTLKLEWNSVSRGLKCPAQFKAPARAKTLVDRLRDSWQHLLRDRATRSLTYNDEQFHVLERIKISETGRRLKLLLENECSPVMAQLAENLGDWYKISQTVYLQTMILEKDLDTFERNFKKLSEEFFMDMNLATKHLITVTEGVSNDKPMNNSCERSRLGASALKKQLKNIGIVSGDISEIIQENSKIIDEFSHLILKINMSDTQNTEM